MARLEQMTVGGKKDQPTSWKHLPSHTHTHTWKWVDVEVVIKLMVVKVWKVVSEWESMNYLW